MKQRNSVSPTKENSDWKSKLQIIKAKVDTKSPYKRHLAPAPKIIKSLDEIPSPPRKKTIQTAQLTQENFMEELLGNFSPLKRMSFKNEYLNLNNVKTPKEREETVDIKFSPEFSPQRSPVRAPVVYEEKVEYKETTMQSMQKEDSYQSFGIKPIIADLKLGSHQQQEQESEVYNSISMFERRIDLTKNSNCDSLSNTHKASE